MKGIYWLYKMCGYTYYTHKVPVLTYRVYDDRALVVNVSPFVKYWRVGAYAYVLTILLVVTL